MILDFLISVMYSLTFKTPVGYLELSSNETALTSVSFVESAKKPSKKLPGILLSAKQQLKEYFSGTRKDFELVLKPEGTEFQLKVWDEISKINFGETASYLDIAKATGSPKNTRAIGLANGKNPIPIIIPCHRVIGSNGKLTGYAGGIYKKRWLLKHELDHSSKQDLLF